MPRVDVVSSYIGADGAMIDACVAAGASGLVTAAGGGGVTTEQELEALSRAVAAGVVVCQASRVTGGRVQLTEERETGLRRCRRPESLEGADSPHAGPHANDERPSDQELLWRG